MKITIEPTNEFLVLDGVQTRVWSGRTDAGTACVVLVHRLVFSAADDLSAAERELLPMLAPRSGSWPTDHAPEAAGDAVP